MRSRLASLLLASVALAGAARTAAAQAALDDDDDTSTTPASNAGTPSEGPKTEIALGFRVRQMFVPKGLIELFVERANGGSSETGLGLELARRKGDFEVQFGLEWDNIYIKPGYWIDKGNTIPQDEPDYVEFDKKGYLSWSTFGWLTAEVTFLNHTEIAKWFSIRYGGGAGIGIIKGHITKIDSSCTTASIDSCSQYGEPQHYSIPPVMLVVNAIVGVQIRPVDKVFINVEGGLRTFPFMGATVGTYF